MPCATRRACATPSSSAASMRRAVSRNAAPAGVNATRLVRASKGAPTCASSRWIAWLNGGCAMCRR